MFDLSRYTDRTHLKRRNTGNNSGWQFATKKIGFEETKFFGDSKYGGPDGSYAKAIAYRDQFLQAARELGIANENGILNDPRPVYVNLSARNTSGIPGIGRYSRPKSKGINIRESQWVANYKTEDGRNEQQSFPIFSLGEQEALLRAVKFRRDYVERTLQTIPQSEYRDSVVNHLDELAEVIEIISGLVDANEVFGFLSTLNSTELTSTEKQGMINLRIAQQRFRRIVLAFWDQRCAITGATSLLTAAHIKPWAVSDDQERLDVFNGIALSPVYDKAFDKGLITFDACGRILISKIFLADAALLAVAESATLRVFEQRHQPYLDWHRKNMFVGV